MRSFLATFLAIFSIGSIFSMGSTLAMDSTGAGLVSNPHPSFDDDDEKAEEKKKPIPPPPADNLALPADLDEKLRGEFDEALELYAAAQKNWGNDGARRDAIRAMKRLRAKVSAVHPLFYLGILYQWERDYRNARKVLVDLIESAPKFYEAHVELGDVEVWEKKLEAAIPHYEKALEIYPYFEYGVDRMMTVLVRLGRFEEARTYVDRALEIGESPLRLQCDNAVKFATVGPDWGQTYEVESDNYIVKTSVSQELAQQTSETAELIRELYDKMFPDISKMDRKYLILVFEDRAGYLKSGAPENSGGIYMSLSRRLMLYRQNPIEDTLMTLKHEGFHQYCHEYLDNIPSWFNEGLADYFSASELVLRGKKRGIRIRPNRKRLEYLVGAFQGAQSYPSLAELMNMSQAQMYDLENGSKLMYLHYCQAWAVCYFCCEGSSKRNQAALIGYFKALRKGKSAAEAYAATFGKLDMRKFQDDWRKFMLETWQQDKGV